MTWIVDDDDADEDDSEKLLGFLLNRSMPQWPGRCVNEFYTLGGIETVEVHLGSWMKTIMCEITQLNSCNYL